MSVGSPAMHPVKVAFLRKEVCRLNFEFWPLVHDSTGANRASTDDAEGMDKHKSHAGGIY